jgi:hypothetical protein
VEAVTTYYKFMFWLLCFMVLMNLVGDIAHYIGHND